VTPGGFWGDFAVLFVGFVISFWFGRYIERVDPLLKKRLSKIGYIITGHKDGEIVRWFTMDSQSARVHIEQRSAEGFTSIHIHTVYCDNHETRSLEDE
jgi:hypothetical protein